MIIETAAKPEEDLDLLCNTLNAEAGRFLYSDHHLYCILIRAQMAISELSKLLDSANELSEEPKDMLASNKLCIVYICDPSKNTDCNRYGCTIDDYCRCTTKKQFAKTGENGKPIVAVRSDQW